MHVDQFPSFTVHKIIAKLIIQKTIKVAVSFNIVLTVSKFDPFPAKRQKQLFIRDKFLRQHVVNYASIKGYCESCSSKKLDFSV